MSGWSSPAAEFPAAAALDAGRLSGCAVGVLVSVVGCSALGVGVGFDLGTRGMCGICAEVTCKLKSATIKNAKVSNAQVSEELLLIFNLSFSSRYYFSGWMQSQRLRGTKLKREDISSTHSGRLV